MKNFKGLLRQDESQTDFVKSEIQQCIRQLERDYKVSGLKHNSGVWNKSHIKKLDLAKFRGDNIFVWQTRKYSEINYYISYKYALSIDELILNHKLLETGAFGVETFEFQQKLVSRDLIDSIIELNYLEKHLQISTRDNFQVIDIGAGYGRLPSRIVEAFPKVHVSCVDAIPVATCVSAYYLREYINKGFIDILRLDTIEKIQSGEIDLAVNIHSFSEMSIESVKFWIEFLVRKKIPYFFLVPNNKRLELNNGHEFGPLLVNAGYELIDTSLKYEDEEIENYAIYPSTYYLFRLRID